MASSTARAFVVGIDGSDSARAAVAWAAREARERRAPLRLVHAYVWPLLHLPRGFRMGPSGGLHAHTERLLEEARRAAWEAAPGVDVDARALVRFPLPMLVEESRDASCVVVGSSRTGPVSMVGSVALGLIAHAYSPVAIVCGIAPDRSHPRVVVGVDGSPSSCAAMRLGVDLAARRHGTVVAVHVARAGPARARAAASGVRWIEEALAGWRRCHPTLPIEERIMSGRPADVLAGLSDQAAAVVVGTRGYGVLAGLLHRSVSHGLVRHARCPVLVVPEKAATELPVPGSP
ncbi:universal stress protein [Thermasporomyces composti]|uniref:Nucleotide-binding universal stress UspA family protein n=1 Tax=Thermasporomyces composti TaxID=696763 RepID=A0A3D9VIS3_THECX|nr:universal stress protein [Thermasporomyces composti]REF38114.1 nucleotide-binding universal stress UspA family protein [Thermasporomyces composti]